MWFFDKCRSLTDVWLSEEIEFSNDIEHTNATYTRFENSFFVSRLLQWIFLVLNRWSLSARDRESMCVCVSTCEKNESNVKCQVIHHWIRQTEYLIQLYQFVGWQFRITSLISLLHIKNAIHTGPKAIAVQELWVNEFYILQISIGTHSRNIKYMQHSHTHANESRLWLCLSSPYVCVCVSKRMDGRKMWEKKKMKSRRCLSVRVCVPESHVRNGAKNWVVHANEKMIEEAALPCIVH